ncbi:uncharacterized protein RHO25_010235 [Cercospora beticola]|uniref:Uncharacterized protein n=1 Tax=Cercospora beticola TaxID=122368 RepID=A0ABZ0P1L7_CERBT|nr:hypothetical protein RHO25_010235 [Cercospora beticola]
MSILEMQTWQGPSRLMAIDYQRGFERSSDPKHLTYEGHFMQLMNVVAAAGLTRARRIKSSWHQESKSWNKKIAMFDILERLHELQCRDDRDRIAAFGWLIDPTWDFAVDYANTVEQVYYQFATRVVERGHFPSTVARMLVSAALRSWQWEEGRLPGWIPDWRVTPMQSDLTSERPKPRPATSNYHKRDLGTALSIYLPGRSSRVECKILEGRVLQLRCIQFTHYVTFVTNAVMDEGFVVRFELGCDVLFSRYDGRANTHKLVTAPTGLPETPYNLGPRGDTIDLTILIV